MDSDLYDLRIRESKSGNLQQTQKDQSQSTPNKYCADLDQNGTRIFATSGLLFATSSLTIYPVVMAN